MSECLHPNPKTFSRDGADHFGIDLFVKCPDCNLEGPYVECIKATAELRRKVWNAWHDEVPDPELPPPPKDIG